MANVSIILGKSGKGKSTSIRNLDPKETCIINLLGKRLPFKGGRSMYNAENKNHFQLDTYQQILSLLENINKSAPHIKTIILEDFTYLMRKEYFDRAKEPGYNKYVEFGQHFQQIVELCEKMREELNVFIIMHPEDIYSEGSHVGYKVATIGKLVDEKYNPAEVVSVILFADNIHREDGSIEYVFYTQPVKVGTVSIMAKTPNGMFEGNTIPNDLKLVIEAMNEYY